VTLTTGFVALKVGLTLWTATACAIGSVSAVWKHLARFGPKLITIAITS